MSTTIDIYPVSTIDITFGQVIETAESHINEYLNSIGISYTIRLGVDLHGKDNTYVHHVRLTDKFEWKDNEYAWFQIEGVNGGTDAYCSYVKETVELDNSWWRLEDLIQNNTSINNFSERIEKTKVLDRYWCFRRSAGQPGIIALSYGLISASVAELTEGILWSDDGAWDFKRFPALSKDFMNWYFKPDKAIDEDYAEFAKRCIDGIEEELQRPTKFII